MRLLACLFVLLSLTPLRAQEAPTPAGAEAPAAEESPRLKVGADASLVAVIPALAQAWADATEGTPVVELELTNAGTLDSYLAKGHPWDVVLVAGRADAQRLTDAGRLRAGGQRLVAQGRLGVIGKDPLIEDEMLDWYDLVRQEWKSVATGDPSLTASGRAAKALMEKRGVAGIASKNLKTVTNTPAGLDLLKRGQADALIVFAAELPETPPPGFRRYAVDPKAIPPVFYTASQTPKTADSKLAESFIDFLVSPEAEAVWRAHGYLEDRQPMPAEESQER